MKKRQWLSSLLGLVIALGMMTGMNLTVYADTGGGNSYVSPYASLVNRPTRISLGSWNWYVIKDESTAEDAGTLTLLCAYPCGLSRFNGDEKQTYSSSEIKSKLEEWGRSSMFNDIWNVTVPTDLPDVGVTGARLFLLSTEEAQALSEEIRKTRNNTGDYPAWWLRSNDPQIWSYADSVLNESGRVVNIKKSWILGVRPAVRINLELVVYDSDSKRFSPKHIVRVGIPSNASVSGNTEQIVVPGQEMEPVVFTVEKDGYYFSPDYDNYTLEGITVRRVDDKTVIVSGRPESSRYVGVENAKKIPASAPTILEQPSPLNLTYGYDSGNTLSFKVAPATDANYQINYRWYVNTKDAKFGSKRIGIDGTSETYTIPAGEAVGTRYYFCVVEAIRSDNGDSASVMSKTVAVTISKADPVANAPGGVTAAYGQTLADVTLANPEGNTAGTWKWAGSSAGVGEVGEHTFMANFTPADTTNYNARENIEVTVTVLKTAAPVIQDVQYDVYGDDYTIEGSVADVIEMPGDAGKLTYAVGGTPIVSPGSNMTVSRFTVNPDGMAAATLALSGGLPGEYVKLPVKITSQNYDDVIVHIVGRLVAKPDAGDKDKTQDVIRKAPAAHNLTANGEVQELVSTGEASSGEIQYALGDNDAATVPTDGWSPSIPTATDPGIYIVWYKVVDDAGQTETEPECIVVAMYDSGVLIYNGEEQELVKSDPVQGGTMLYALGKDNVTAPEEGWSDKIPSVKEPGDYYVWYKVSGDGNHNDTEPECILVTIVPDSLIEMFTELIGKIPENVTLESSTLVDVLEAVYDSLSESQKKLISEEDFWKQLEAELKIGDLKEAERFIEAVNAVAGNKAGEGKGILDKATEIFNSLTDEQKAFIPAETVDLYNEAVKAFKGGRKFRSGDGYYRVLFDGDVIYLYPADKTAESAVVPNQVKKGRFMFKVVRVSNNAFAGCSNLQWILINKNTRAIGGDAFNGTTALTKIAVKSSGIEAGNVVDAFAGAGKNGRLTIKVPESMVNEYSELFTGEGRLNGNVIAA